MELTGKYRHELKYSISLADRMALVRRLRPLMQRDPHTDETGRYTIRSVYFDNYKDKALREKRNGVQTREKFRIRYYNDDLSFITLEKKIKHNDLCKKLDAPLTAEEYQLTELFFRQPRQVFSSAHLFEKIWGLDSQAEMDVVWTYISFLRRKLKQIGADVEIRTIRGAGYALEEMPC